MTVDFSTGVDAALPVVTGVTVRTRTDRQCVLDVTGPLGPLLQALSALPVHDIQIEPFRLEDYIAGFYGRGRQAMTAPGDDAAVAVAGALRAARIRRSCCGCCSS